MGVHAAIYGGEADAQYDFGLGADAAAAAVASCGKALANEHAQISAEVADGVHDLGVMVVTRRMLVT